MCKYFSTKILSKKVIKSVAIKCIIYSTRSNSLDFFIIYRSKKKKTDSAYDIKSIFVSILCYPNGRTQIMLALLVPLVSTLFGSFSLLVIHFQVLHQRLQTHHAIHTTTTKTTLNYKQAPLLLSSFGRIIILIAACNLQE